MTNNKIMKIIYELFADAYETAINNKKKRISNKESKFYLLLVLNTSIFSIIMIFVLFIEEFIGEIYYPINYFSYKIINYTLTFLPFILGTYYFFYYKKGYKKYLINRKIKTKGIAFILLFAGSVALFFTILIIFAGGVSS